MVVVVIVVVVVAAIVVVAIVAVAIIAIVAIVAVVVVVVVGGGRRAGRRKNALHCLVMKQKLPRLYGITVWDLRPLLSCCWGYSLGLFVLLES